MERMLFGVLTLALTGLGTCQDCPTNLIACQEFQHSSISHLQQGNYESFCRLSYNFTTCVESDLRECDQTLYNVSTLTKNIRRLKDVYCPDGQNPGYVECLSRLTACEDIYNQSQEFIANQTVHCSLLDEYVLCAVRDLVHCHSQFFDIVTHTSITLPSYKSICLQDSETESCSSLYVGHQEVFSASYVALSETNTQLFCSKSEDFLEKVTSVVSSCDSIFNTATQPLTTRVVQDRTIHCVEPSSTTFTPNPECLKNQTACQSLLYVTGNVENTIIILYCRSLDKYRSCLVHGLQDCESHISVTDLREEASRNFTKYCSKINLNTGSVCFPQCLIILIFAALLNWL